MGNKIPSNPPAFPSHGTLGEVVQEGMTMRDYFAAKAIDGAVSIADDLTGTAILKDLGIDPNTPWDTNRHYFPAVALYAYRIADAMLTEREKI